MLFDDRSKPFSRKAYGRAGFIFLFTFIMLFTIAGFAAGYTNVFYDDFDNYTAGTPVSSLPNIFYLQQYDIVPFIDSQSNVYMPEPAGGFTAVAAIKYKNSPFCISQNDTGIGLPVNFSMRVKMRVAESEAVALTFQSYMQIMPGHTGVSYDVDVPYIRINANISGDTQAQGCIFNMTTASTTCANLSIFPTRPTQYMTFQIDYYMTRNVSANLNYIYRGDVTLLETGMVFSVSNIVNQPTPIICFNSTWYQYRIGDYVLDYMHVIKYAPDESFLPYTTPIALPFGGNQYPEYDEIVTFDKFAQVTDRVPPSTACFDYSASTCNPLYFQFFNEFDPENNTLDVALFCDYDDSIFYSENFSGANSAIAASYGLCNDTQKRAYTGGFAYQFNDTFCPDEIFLFGFAADYLNPYYLYNNRDESYLIAFDFSVSTGTDLNITLIDANNDIVKAIAFVPESGEGKLYIDGIFTSSFDLLVPGMIYSYLMILNTDTNRIELSVRDDTGTLVLYEAGILFDWGLPIAQMQIATDAGNGQLVADLSVAAIDLPAFEGWTPSQEYACFQSQIGEYAAYMFLTDDQHPDSYLNGEIVPYTISNYNLNGELIYAVSDEGIQEGLDAIFMGSQSAKYIFAIFVILAVVIVSFIGGAKYMDSGMSGAILSIFTGLIVTILFVVIGILPVWILIIIFMIAGIAGAIAFRSAITGGGAGGG